MHRLSHLLIILAFTSLVQAQLSYTGGVVFNPDSEVKQRF